MLDTVTDRPPADVIGAVAAAGWRTEPGSWRPLSGGRTNRLWRVSANGEDLVCKLFVSGAATPLFPNDPVAEALALRALAGTGLAPSLRGTLRCGSGAVVIYDYVAPEGRATPAAAAAALARLHALAPPNALRRLRGDASALVAQADRILREVSDPRACALAIRRPPVPVVERISPVFLHGDPVPANIVLSRSGPCLIDWQCPALGDPTEDLALFLSPAMQSIYGGPVLDAVGIETFLKTYGDVDRAARYHELAAIHHYRMAAYCLWKAQAGDADYGPAADMEIACLDQRG